MNRLQLDPYLARWIDYIVDESLKPKYTVVFTSTKIEDISYFMGEYYNPWGQYKLGKTNLNEFKWVDSNMSGSNTKE